MSNAPLTPCTAPWCRCLAWRNQRCRQHQRPSAAARGYDGAWARYAREWLARFPCCGMRQDGEMHEDDSVCARHHLRVPARVVDHIRSLAMGGALMDPANHQSLCASCNRRKG